LGVIAAAVAAALIAIYAVYVFVR
ncbi:MAG TPA: DedA family protein, partial [Agrobacterium sp.]|nr:DedA family protein [Agrobacterium sp.]